MSQDVPEEVIARQPEEAQAIIRILLARIEALEARLNKTPRNSSLPPSNQHPHVKPAPTKPKSKRKPGGQPGHEKFERALVPPEQVHETIPLKPTECRRCGTRLKGSDADPLRHQVWELPEIQPIITEYQRHRLTCSCCGASTCAELPPGVPEGQSGPRLVAFVTLLMAYFRQSKRRVGLFCETVLNTPCSPGLTVKLQNQATAALAPCYNELAQALPEASVANLDETGSKQGPDKSWIWVAVTNTFTLFAVRLTRSAEVARELLGETFRGTITTDRFGAYNGYPRRQVCWAHLLRDFQALIDADGSGKRIGLRLMEVARKLFHHWQRYRDGTVARETMRRHVRQLYYPLWEILEDGQRSRHAPTAALCRDLFDRFDQLWMFLDHPDVEPTNNAAERALRHAVIWRKLSFGTKSAAGSRFVETMLTVIETCRQQNRDVFEFLTKAIERRLAHRRAPSLLAGV